MEQEKEKRQNTKTLIKEEKRQDAKVLTKEEKRQDAKTLTKKEKNEKDLQKERLDILLVKKGFAGSREKAKALIISGGVFVDGQQQTKSGNVFLPSAEIEVKGAPLRYVSRGGLKLEKAVFAGWVDLKNAVCIDIGASTGGFTDCMLQAGSERVYAVDVGTGQLDEKLYKDKRVISMERTNVRYITPQDIPEAVDFAAVDVAFISLALVLAPIKALMKPAADIVCLIKPQFEAGRKRVGKKGVVKDAKIHKDVIEGIIKLAAGLGFEMLHLDYSPIKGPEGNIEYLLHMRNSTLEPEDVSSRKDVIEILGIITETVSAASRELSRKE